MLLGMHVFTHFARLCSPTLRARVRNSSVRARALQPTPTGPQPHRLLRPARETCGLALGRSSCSLVGACVPLAAVVVVPVGVWAALCPVCGVWP